jgi:hypothetical protein
MAASTRRDTELGRKGLDARRKTCKRYSWEGLDFSLRAGIERSKGLWEDSWR